eukprot:9891496-Alexandrium_andersonii.AAC.1
MPSQRGRPTLSQPPKPPKGPIGELPTEGPLRRTGRYGCARPPLRATGRGRRAVAPVAVDPTILKGRAPVRP